MRILLYRENLPVGMSEATYEWEDKASPPDEKEISDIDASDISKSDYNPSSTKFLNTSAEKTSSSQLANTSLKTTSSTSVLNSSNENIHPASIERCVSNCGKFFILICVYYLFLSIVDCIVSFIYTLKRFIQKYNVLFPLAMIYYFISTVGNLLSDIISLVYIMHVALFTQSKENLQQPVRTVLRSPTTNSLPLVSKHSSTFPQNNPDCLGIPKTFEQQRSSVVPRPELMRPQKINPEICTMRKSLKDPVPMHSVRYSPPIVKDRNSLFIDSLPKASKCLSYFSRKSQVTPQTIQIQRFSAVQRVEVIHPRTSNNKTFPKDTGSKNKESLVHIRRTTSIVEEFWSYGSSFFRQRRSNQQQHNGKKGVSEKAPKNHGTATGKNAPSSKQKQSTDPRWKEKHNQVNSTRTHTHDKRKGVFAQAAQKHSQKTGENAFSSKQCGNTVPRQKEKHSGTNNIEIRIYDGKKGVFHQTKSNTSKAGEKASSGKQQHKTPSQREEKRPKTSNAASRTHDGKKGVFQKETPMHGSTPGKKVSSNKHQNIGRGKKA